MALSDINVNIPEQAFQLDDEELKLKCPFKLMISGSSGVGKSRWVQNLLKSQFYEVQPEIVYLCIPRNSTHVLRDTIEEYKQSYPGLILHEGIPSLGEFTLNPDQHKLLIFDDMSIDVENSKEIHDLCVVTSRKSQISVIFITQNLYQTSRFGLSIRRNISYFTLFSTFGDYSNVKSLGRTFFSDNTLQKSFKMLAKSNKEFYKNYLFLDCHHKSIFPHSMRLRSNIFDLKYPQFFVYDI